MNRYELTRDYLKTHAPPGQFTVLGLGEEASDLCSRLRDELGASCSCLFATADLLAAIRTHDHVDVVLVPPVLHRNKNWYEYLEAILGVADIAIFETVNIGNGVGLTSPELIYARGIHNELSKMGEHLSNRIPNPRVAGLWVVNRKLIRGEEAQTAMLEEILRGFNANVDSSHFRVSEEALDGIAGGLVTALKYHGWVMHYDPAITAANLNQIVLANPVPDIDTRYQPDRLSES